MKTQKDRYEPYYKGNGFGQQKFAKSMPRLSKFFKKHKVTQILDFYCGTGRNAIYLAEQGFDVHGFDGSRLGLSIARRKQKVAKTTVKFKLLELAGRLPYKDNQFDAVIIIRALYQDKMAAIRKNVAEITRITKPGGYVYLESNQNFKDWHTKEHRKQVRRVGIRTYQYLDNGTFYHFFTKQELKALFEGYKTARFYFKDKRFYVLMQKPSVDSP